MTTNRLAKSNSPIAPKEEDERRRFWIERGNRVLWGEEKTEKHGFLKPRRDLEWVCRNGSYSIESRRARATSSE